MLYGGISNDRHILSVSHRVKSMRDTLYKAQILCYVNKEQTVFCLFFESNKLEYDKHRQQRHICIHNEPRKRKRFIVFFLKYTCRFEINIYKDLCH